MGKLRSDPSELLRLISGVSRRLEVNLQGQLRPNGLSVEQFRVLEALQDADGLAMGEIAARIFVDSATLTKIIDRMVSNALVYRAPDSADRRRVLIFLAPNGIETLKELRSPVRECQKNLIGHLPSHEADKLRDLLKSFLRPFPE